jgi:hypothetical protein
MASASHRSVNRIPDTDWAEVLSRPGGHSLGVGHLKDISEGGLSVELPACLPPGLRVEVRLSTLTSDVLRHYTVSGVVTHAETAGTGCVHGIKFQPLTQDERTALTDYLCQVEYHHRAAP